MAAERIILQQIASLPRYAMLGHELHAISQDQLLGYISGAIAQSNRLRICHLNLHGVRVAQQSDSFRQMISQADLLYIDGMPLIWTGRLLGYPLSREHRITGIDWLPPVLKQANAQRWKVFLLGHHPQVLPRIRAYVQERYPQIQFDAHDGYFAPAENHRVAEQINQFSPDLLILGMGMPRQENWLGENHDRLQFKVAVCVGATFDYFVNAIPTPPRWTGKLGLEWLYRLISEPRRLASRYLVEPWFLIPSLMRDFKRVYLSRSKQQ